MPLSAQIKQADLSHPLCKVLRKRSSSMVLWTGNTGAQWRDGETWVEWMSGSTLGLPGQIATDTALQAHHLKGHPCITNPCPSRGKRDKWASLQMACVPKMQWSGTVRGWSCGRSAAPMIALGVSLRSLSSRVRQGTTGGGSCLQLPHKQEEPWEKDKMSWLTEKISYPFFVIKQKLFSMLFLLLHTMTYIS